MEHDPGLPDEPTQPVEQPQSVWQRDAWTRDPLAADIWAEDTMPAGNRSWSEQPTAPLPIVRPQAQRETAQRPQMTWQRVRGASRQALLSLGCSGLLLAWFFAILIAAVLSTGGLPGLPGVSEGFGPFVHAGAGATATPTQRSAPSSAQSPQSKPPVSTVTPNVTATPMPTDTVTPTPTEAATPTPQPSPTDTATPRPTPTPIPTSTPAPTSTPNPTPTLEPSPSSTATPTSAPEATGAVATPSPSPTPTPEQ